MEAAPPLSQSPCPSQARLATTLPTRLLCALFLTSILSFAWLRFSDNTVDNDLWGHVLYGQRILASGDWTPPETLSWTAYGLPWYNHELLAEVVMGWIHAHAGGSGLWLYMMLMSGLTVGLALTGDSKADHWQKMVAWALFGASVNFIALGFAVRPQLFTALALVVLLRLLRGLSDGRNGLALFIPVLVVVWVNAHGGVLAGILCLGVMVGTETVFPLVPTRFVKGWHAEALSHRALLRLWGLLLCSLGALLVNPWGYKLVTWTVDSLQLARVELHEWQAMDFTWANLPFFVVVLMTFLGWAGSQKPRLAWQALILLMLAFMALMQQRHAPLFGLANLLFTPSHLADTLKRLRPRCASLIELLSLRGSQVICSILLCFATLLSLRLSISAPKEHPFTLEVENNCYPVAAIAFIKQHRLYANTLTFFDWGQHVLWELPLNPVSFDGRLDTVYPKSVMDEHWALYRGERMDQNVRWEEAELALLPTESGGQRLLLKNGWRLVYQDPLASILVRLTSPCDQRLRGVPTLLRGEDSLTGRTPFPEEPSEGIAHLGHR